MSIAPEQRHPDMRLPALSFEQKAALNLAVDLINTNLAHVLVAGMREHVQTSAFTKFLESSPTDDRILDFAARHPHMLPLPMCTCSAWFLSCVFLNLSCVCLQSSRILTFAPPSVTRVFACCISSQSTQPTCSPFSCRLAFSAAAFRPEQCTRAGPSTSVLMARGTSFIHSSSSAKLPTIRSSVHLPASHRPRARPLHRTPPARQHSSHHRRHPMRHLLPHRRRPLRQPRCYSPTTRSFHARCVRRSPTLTRPSTLCTASVARAPSQYCRLFAPGRGALRQLYWPTKFWMVSVFEYLLTSPLPQ